MTMKTFVWGGMFAGSGLGSVLPLLWGDSALSFASIVLSSIGAAVGVWAGYVLGKYLGA
jgi:hypothetical protein